MTIFEQLMRLKTPYLALLAFMALASCSARKSTTFPDYAATRVKVNTGSAQSASLEARTAVVEIKNSKEEIERLSSRLETMKVQVESSRMKIAR